MRQNNNSNQRRSRNNNNNNNNRNRNRSGPNSSGRQNFDSNGPSVRIRGSASQIYDKYAGLARDATTSGDPVMAESLYQHAEHYYRIAAEQEAQKEARNANRVNNNRNRDKNAEPKANSDETEVEVEGNTTLESQDSVTTDIDNNIPDQEEAVEIKSPTKITKSLKEKKIKDKNIKDKDVKNTIELIE